MVIEVEVAELLLAGLLRLVMQRRYTVGEASPAKAPAYWPDEERVYASFGALRVRPSQRARREALYCRH